MKAKRFLLAGLLLAAGVLTTSTLSASTLAESISTESASAENIPAKSMVEQQAVIAIYEEFISASQGDTPVASVAPLLAKDSPLSAAMSGGSAKSALTQFGDMLSHFNRMDTRVEIDGSAAHLIATGTTPVQDPNVQRFMQTANVTHKVDLVRQGGDWKIYQNDYKVRYSD